MTNAKFATLVACIDGRAYGPVVEWVKRNYGVDFVDLVTVPGVDKDVTLAQAGVEISVRAHKSKLVVVAGHYDCAGNPVSGAEHKSQIRQGAEEVTKWGLNVEVVGVWVNSDWWAERVA